MSHLVGKVFKRGGGRYPGLWIVVGISPGGGAICLGVDKDHNLVGATTYQPYYVERKKELFKIDVTKITFHNGQAQTPDLSAVLDQQPS